MQIILTMHSGVLSVVLLLIAFVSVEAQLKPCDLYDPATDQPVKPAYLSVEVNETDPATLAARPEDYRKVVGIYGQMNSNDPAVNISLKMDLSGNQGLDVKDPNEFFKFIQIGTQVYLQMIKAVDRDGPTASPLDDTDLFEFTLVCTKWNDPTNPYFNMGMFIHIDDINDNAPEFVNTPYVARVSELTPVAVPPLVIFNNISAIDKDAVGPLSQVSYQLESVESGLYDASGKFEILWPSRGEVMLIGSLDFEPNKARPYYLVRIIATDNPNGSSTQIQQSTTTTMTISILDGNDLPPTFVYAGCTLIGDYCINPRYTGVTNGAALSTVTLSPAALFARDVDTLNAPITYSFATGSPANYATYFGIDANSGVITLLQDVNRPIMPQVNLTVVAREVSLEAYFTDAFVSISVSPVNNFPPTIVGNNGGLTAFVAENSAVQTLLSTNAQLNREFQITPTDQDVLPTDPRPSFTYQITSNEFAVDSNGFITVNQVSLDFERQPVYTFPIIVTEADTVEHRASTATVTVSLMNINDFAPVFVSDYYTSNVTEGSAARTVTTVQATDQDFGPPTYSISSVTPTSGTGLFSIDGATGLVTITGQVNIGQVYMVKITATDQGSLFSTKLSSSTMLAVTIVPAGDRAPFFPANQYQINVTEATDIGQQLIVIQAVDPDTDPLTYTTSNLVNLFSISATGAVNLITKLDRETLAQVTAAITASDGQQTAQTTLTVNIGDANDNAPIFSSANYTVSVNENMAADTSVLTVTATDADATSPNNLINYVTQDTTAFKIDPSTGVISTVAPLDREQIIQYVFYVRAVDQGVPTLFSIVKVTVNVNDVNDNAPLFAVQNQTVFIPETAAINTPVVRVAATDVDATPIIVYQIVSGDPDGTFVIDAASGQISTAKALNYDTAPQYILQVSTQGATGYNNQTTTVSITVISNLRRNEPVWVTDYETTVDETTPVGVIVLNVRATSTTQGVIVYAMADSSALRALVYFQIDPLTGAISQRKSVMLDPIKDQPYIFDVTVRNDVGPVIRSQPQRATVTISVSRNLNAPNITNLPATVSLSRDANVQTTRVIQVTATDADTTSPFRDVTYSIVGDDYAAVQFGIDSRTGLINLTRAIPGTPNMYMVRVRATDGGSPAQYDEKLVTVNITQNLNGPAFTATEYSRVIPETTTPGASVLTVFATECGPTADPPPYNFTYYRLTHDYFWINQTSGRIYLKQSLNGISGQLYMYVEAYDLGVPSKTAQVVVWVRVDR